jgi:hypothetical protein
MCITAVYLVSSTGCYYDKQVIPLNCDSTAIRYSGDIQSILTANCTSCHYRSNEIGVGGGYNFEAYTVIRNMAISGKLLASLRHAPGALPMPKNAKKLSDCDIAKFTNWVNNGAPQ